VTDGSRITEENLRCIKEYDVQAAFAGWYGAKTITDPPRGTQPAFAEAINRALAYRASPEHWHKEVGTKLLKLIPAMILSIPTERLKAHKLKELVATRLSKFLAGKFSELLTDMENSQEALQESGKRRRARRQGGERQSDHQQAKQYVAEGLPSMAMKCLVKNEGAGNSEEVYNALLPLHPQTDGTHPSAWEAEPEGATGPEICKVERKEVIKAIMGIRRRVSPGLSGWKAEHLQSALKYSGKAYKAELGNRLTALVTDILSAKVPQAVLDLFRNAKLVAIRKPGSATAVRPIALMETLSKVAERVAVGKLRELSPVFIKEMQFGGPGVKGGVEAVPHVLRAALSKRCKEAADKGEPAPVMITTDVKNAFNCIQRKYIVEGVRENCPDLLPYVASQYKTPSNLFFMVDGEQTSRIILSKTGVRQGSALSTVLFDMALLQITRLVRAEAGGDAEIVLVHDDLTIVGKQEAVAKALRKLFEELPKAGMELNVSKFKAYMPRPNKEGHIDMPADASQVDTAAFHPGGFRLYGETENLDEHEGDANTKHIPLVQGVKVAGAPIGSQLYVRDELEKVVQEAREQAEAIVEFSAKELQCAALIHRATLPTKPVFLLRTLPPDITETFARDFNNVVLMSFKRMLGLDAPWRDATRSREAEKCLDYQLLAQPKDGGWGLFDAEETADICYVASHCLTAPLLAAVPSLRKFYEDVHRLPSAETIPSHGHVVTELTKAVEEVHRRVQQHTTSVLPSTFAGFVNTPVSSMQRTLREAADPIKCLPRVSSAFSARIHSLSGKGATAWTRAFPSIRQLTFTNTQFRTATYLMLGQPLPEMEKMRQCLCGSALNPDGLGMHYVTKACRQGLRLSTVGHGLTARHNAMTNAWAYLARRAGVKVTIEQQVLPNMPPMQRGDITFHDLDDTHGTCVGDVLVSSIFSADGTVRPAAREAGGVVKVGEKEKREKYKNLGAKFLPLVFETFGRMNTTAEDTLKLLAKKETNRGFEHTSMDDEEEGLEEGEWSRVYSMAIGRSRQVLSSVLAKEVALSVQHGVHDSLTYQDTFTNFQTGSNMDAADDLIASAIAGGPVASHV
jgi:hypothetical protein